MSSQPDSQAFNDSLIEESFDEAAFLWSRWEAELTSLTRNVDEVWSWTEDRLQGALDGARVARERLADIVAGGLTSDDPGRMSTSAALLGSSGEPAAAGAIVTALQAADGPALRALVRGIELLGSGSTARAAVGVLLDRGPEGAGELCRLKAFRRVAAGSELSAAFDSGRPDSLVNVMRAAASLPMPQAQEWITAGLQHDEPVVQAAAVESGLARGLEPAWRAAQQGARELPPHAAPYLKLLALLGAADDHDVVYSALRVPALQRHAIWALGHIGTVRAAETCLAGMQHEALARACGEAYCWITGADLSRDRLAMSDVQPDAPAFEDDDPDADLVPPLEMQWPVPDRDAVERHWRSRQPALDATARYILGVPATLETTLAAIESGPMLRRPDLVLELRARSRGRYDVETRAFAARQRQMMAAGRAALSTGGH